MKTITFDTVYNALKNKGYELFETDTKPYNLNIIGIRNDNRTPNSFDDCIVVIWKYKGQWNFNKYEALTQFMPVTVIRDFDKDNYLDFASGKEETGLFGINIHRANLTGKSIKVNQWSAGCQVFADSGQFNEFISLCEMSQKYWGKTFSYTLVNFNDL